MLPVLLLSQQGSVKGRIFDESNNEPIPFANIVVFGTTIGSTSDLDGNFIFTGLTPGFIKLAVSAVGYEMKVTEDFQVTNARTFFINVPLKPKKFELQEVVITASPLFTQTWTRPATPPSSTPKRHISNNFTSSGNSAPKVEKRLLLKSTQRLLRPISADGAYLLR
ncbi:MAG: carboxypeptidase-like regulatory domain-containing protein [Bacteroidales bacterium]|nr:carboxypeptidase-like regulatory domain-containing protein [Bacteroidales bacterium]